MAHFFVVLRKMLLNALLYAHILKSASDYKMEVPLGYTSSHFTCPPRIALICVGPVVEYLI